MFSLERDRPQFSINIPLVSGMIIERTNPKNSENSIKEDMVVLLLFLILWIQVVGISLFKYWGFSDSTFPRTTPRSIPGNMILKRSIQST